MFSNFSCWSVLNILRWSSSYLNSVFFENSKVEIELLLSYSLSFSRLSLFLKKNMFLSTFQLLSFAKLFIRKISNEPIFYIVGNKCFFLNNFVVDDRVLIPRFETEILVNSVCVFLEKYGSVCGNKILELGTGSGAVIIDLAKKFPNNDFYAVDISLSSLEIAKKNAYMHNLIDNIRFLHGNWIDCLQEQSLYFDCILSNPPYISTGKLENLDLSVCLYEPLLAIDGGQDGLFCLREIIKIALKYLKSGGLLALEIDHGYGRSVKSFVDLFEGYFKVTVLNDFSGFERVVSMVKK